MKNMCDPVKRFHNKQVKKRSFMLQMVKPEDDFNQVSCVTAQNVVTGV